jgi:hypothetical protein
MMAMMMAACVTSSVFISKANFMPGAGSEGGNVKWTRGRVLVKCSRERKETRDNADGRSQGDGISMVLGEGEKPGGEQVSITLVYAPPRITDRPTMIVEPFWTKIGVNRFQQSPFPPKKTFSRFFQI